MRERFILCSRVIGLLLVCGGIIMAASSIPAFIMEPDWTKMVPDYSGLSPQMQSIVRQVKEEAAKSGSYIWRITLSSMIVQGILPILLGLYLMKSNNIFVRSCYGNESSVPRPAVPERESPTGPTESETEAPPPRPVDDDSKWKPPEYRQ